jgi:hypothetical protein
MYLFSVLVWEIEPKLVEQVHPSNIKVISMITTLEALHVVEGGVYIVVAQGLKQEAIAQHSS